MSEATLDDRGRLTVPKELRERYGDRYRIGELHDGIKLVPVESDPLAALREEFEDVDESAADLQSGARRDALDEAGR
jgi:bifunctional DNA-binding transcriptional regulator/antitoxin component of YhaV-PrlF toxin-antitoxin module